ncbi:MAG: sulfite exporter TauE/SafE family protein [Sulfurimicrobium sp.]|jgi:hypothetical protein|nr:sulfite exporter TauE/SafE family protein [Sulfurimicrobium sp.]MDZ7657557.1 sulfite exporter TauE/SafE family protein [Sulfurimicrobium sp.]
MDFFHFFLLMCAGALGGAANAIAGGGTFFTFPALLAAGVPPVAANATNSFAIWPGNAIALFSYRDELGRHRASLPWLLAAGLLGGGLGGWLLVQSTDRSFMRLVPVLMLAATAAFAFKTRVLAQIRGFLAHSRHSHRILTIILTFMVGIYGGYFNAGLGIMLLAALSLGGIEDHHELNGLKNLVSVAVSTFSVIILVISGAISWPHAWITLLGAIAGGYLGGRYARRIPKLWLERIIIGTGSLLTVVYAIKVYT